MRDAGSVDRPIADEADVEAVIGAPMVFVRMKVRDHLDAGMRDFIAHAPLVLVSTVDEDGHLDVSPKGDPPGFVQVDDAGDLLKRQLGAPKATRGKHRRLGLGGSGRGGAHR